MKFVVMLASLALLGGCRKNVDAVIADQVQTTERLKLVYHDYYSAGDYDVIEDTETKKDQERVVRLSQEMKLLKGCYYNGHLDELTGLAHCQSAATLLVIKPRPFTVTYEFTLFLNREARWVLGPAPFNKVRSDLQ